MTLPVGILDHEEIEEIFSYSIDYHIQIFEHKLKQYEVETLFDHWKDLLQSIEEFINIPWELESNEETETILSLSLDYRTLDDRAIVEVCRNIIEKHFGFEVSFRFEELISICVRLHKYYYKYGLYRFLGYGLNLSTVQDAIIYFQSRRSYFTAIQNLIPFKAKGTTDIKYENVLQEFASLIDQCLVAVTTAYNNLVLNHSGINYEMLSNGAMAVGDFDHSALEGFFAEPEQLSLMDQLELRPEELSEVKFELVPEGRIFSFTEVMNAVHSIGASFEKYKLAEHPDYASIRNFMEALPPFVQNDYSVEIPKEDFQQLVFASSYLKQVLTVADSSYLNVVNSYAPFAELDGIYYATVNSLNRFLYKAKNDILLKNRAFKIRSGYVFEDRVASILTAHGFTCTGITRINHKEFDLITIREEKIYNFQCKNNFFDIATISADWKKIGAFNRRLVRYYNRALEKEKKREGLILNKLKLPTIEHFVLSRYPVITRNPNIITFKNFECFLVNNLL